MTDTINKKNSAATAPASVASEKPQQELQSFMEFFSQMLKEFQKAQQNKVSNTSTATLQWTPPSIPVSVTLPKPTILIPIEDLGTIVQQERKKQKITRDVLSKLSGVSVGTIVAIERKKKTITMQTAQKVLAALGKTLWIK